MVRTEPECRARRKVELARAAPFFPEGCAGATWRIRHHHLNEFAAEPPAHYRLVSGHDLFRRRGLCRLYRRDACARRLKAIGDGGVRYHDGSGLGSFLLVRQERHFSRSRQDRVGAPGRARQGRPFGRPAPRGRLDARGSRHAKIGGGLVACRSHLRTTRRGSSPRRGRDGESGSGERKRGRARSREARVAQNKRPGLKRRPPFGGQYSSARMMVSTRVVFVGSAGSSEPPSMSGA
jgi:hypothetical protein